MRIKILLLLIAVQLFSNENINIEYKHGCKIPDDIIETIRRKENKNNHPFYIRTNDLETLDKFNRIVKKYKHNFPFKNDKKVIDCIDTNNCVSIATDLILNKIDNLDLGLFQINYQSFPYNLNQYFISPYNYKIACEVLYEKIRITKKWDWKTIAAYYSLTPNLNKEYKDELQSIYQEIVLEKQNKRNIINSSNNKISNNKNSNSFFKIKDDKYLAQGE